jgi:hypothetical protein
MSFAEFFRDYWWLMFPIFGMAMAVMGMFQSERRSNQAMDVIKSYIDQGKEPPAELLKLAAEGDNARPRNTPQDHRAWSFITFAAIAAGMGTGYYFVQSQDWSFVFLIGAVTMGVMALGSLVLLFTRKS